MISRECGKVKIKKNICSLLTAITLSSPSFSPSVADAYDKNDNYITEKVVESLKSPAVLILVQETLNCADFIFFDEPQGCNSKVRSTVNYTAGSGTILEDKKGNKYILTSNHILPGDNFVVSIYTLNNDFVNATVYKKDHRQDLALLQIKTEDIGLLAPASGNCYGTNYSIGDYVVGVGYTMFQPSYIKGFVHSISLENKLINIGGHFIGGNSGGTSYAFNHGHPVGIGIMALHNRYHENGLNGIVSSNVIIEFLKDTLLEHYICKGEGGGKSEKSEKEGSGK